MFIEFTGMVGAGKTTIATVMTQLLQARGFPGLTLSEATICCLERSWLGRAVCLFTPSIRWRKRILLWLYVKGIVIFYQVYFVITNRKLCWQVYTSQLHRQIPWWHRRIILNLFFKLAAGYQFLRYRLYPDEVVILEEGWIHRAINLYAWEMKDLDQDLVMRYFDLLPTLDLVVLVQVPFSVSLERVNMSGLPIRLKNKDQVVIDKFMANATQIIQLADGYLATSSRQIIKIDNSRPLEGNLKRIHQHLTEGLDRVLSGAYHSKS